MIITGADTNHEDLLPWWLYNVKKHNPNIDVMIWDFGLSLEMHEYLHKNNVNVSPPLIRVPSALRPSAFITLKS